MMEMESYYPEAAFSGMFECLMAPNTKVKVIKERWATAKPLITLPRCYELEETLFNKVKENAGDACINGDLFQVTLASGKSFIAQFAGDFMNIGLEYTVNELLSLFE